MRDKGQRRDLWFSGTSAAMAADMVAPPRISWIDPN